MKHYDVAAYVWPAYTGNEPRTRMFWPEGIGEWQSVRNAVKKFPEHDWPRKPLWGYVNEADPYVMEGQISAAADHGVNVFIYDWYWYDRRPFLENCLNDGYLKATNNNRVKFYLMWANHHVKNIWDIRISEQDDNIIWDATVDRKEFERIGHRLVTRYFTHPSYYKIEGNPVFSIYDVQNLIKGIGSVDETAQALLWFRDQAVKAGLPGLHLQLIHWGATQLNMSGIDDGVSAAPVELVKKLGFDSCSHYQFVHFTDIDRDYQEIMQNVVKEWDRIDEDFEIPYFPHISVGWDNNPRFKAFKPGIVKNANPGNLQKALKMAKDYIDAHPNQSPLVTINSWNEWTETSYLQPDNLYGYGYLEAVKNVFYG